ncbi:hypothetical protein ABFT80_07605 [Mesorhizobium sp. SB112]|uniref:hypothetical protein n=1 Tax=Mesorhizobium sp. SB112 TaxID=3151853 RepID=UPI0032642822
MLKPYSTPTIYLFGWFFRHAEDFPQLSSEIDTQILKIAAYYCGSEYTAASGHTSVVSIGPHTQRINTMAKGQVRSNREVRKPKKEKAPSKPEPVLGSLVKQVPSGNAQGKPKK